MEPVPFKRNAAANATTRNHVAITVSISKDCFRIAGIAARVQSQTFYFGRIERIMARRGEEKKCSEPESRRSEEQKKIRRAADTRSAARSAGSGLPGPARTGRLNRSRLLVSILRDPLQLLHRRIPNPAFYRSSPHETIDSILSFTLRIKPLDGLKQKGIRQEYRARSTSALRAGDMPQIN
ncbi:hypothetical protein SB394_27375 [Burkholderia sp. BCCIQ04A]|uniref:Uncharacterized protein n=1 Tax=Burkholderia anthinoferrum TaxID=3090833 RepID=A0ABU5WKN5_9BURK|nr:MULTISPECIES: hypothetical protein [Burkholderia]MEB2503832.1 hypothetical protein [Burkholderia anthinoferrum]MEB2533254.1 hypothetical protein [Burkholderia anthinoferrum]MEB2561492.1 hypothetical protein [Burkholderia anthinoferrum]MEB2579524.1 hypothetical protein [Burkholderia anthinoferrum]MCA8106939.1 hypothetical protein [Burkholderia sp. AU36459]